MSEQTEEQDYKTIHNVADRKVPIYRQAFYDSFGEFESEISAAAIDELVRVGAFDAINFAIPWEELRKSVRTNFSPEVLQTIIDAADKTSVATRQVVSQAVGLEVDIAFDSSSQRVRQYLESEIGTLITEMTTEEQRKIGQMVQNAQLSEASSNTLVRDIKRNLGLRTDQYNALENYRAGLEASDLKPSRITQLTNEYRERLLSQRATLIARTETMRAANFGMLEGYQQASDEGLINRNTSTKTWVTTPDDRLCATCAPMDGVTIPMNSQWMVTIYQENALGTVAKGRKAVRVPNEIHPNCRCAMTINPKPN